MTSVTVRTENLCKSFAENHAVVSVSLSISAGKIFGIVGPDGAGKSTLLRMLSSIMLPDSGTADICGFDTVKQDEQVKKRIAYMSQRFGLYPDLTVEENIKFYANIYGISTTTLEARIDELLHFSYMQPFKKRLAGKLSGGKKQKLQLICALIHTPEVLILDEPTNGVDPVSRRDFWRMLQDLSEKGVTIIVSTSYLDEAERCHELALMHAGKIFKQGSLDQIIAESGIAVSVWQGNSARELHNLLEKAAKSAGTRLFGDSIRVQRHQNFAMLQFMINETATRHNLSGNWVSEEKANLEDVFVSYLENHSQTDEEQLSHFNPLLQSFPDGKSVKISNLRRVFGDFTAVDSISLEVGQGEIFGFLGPNGAGKSTTIRMLCGLLMPTSGQGTVAGHDLFKDSEKLKQSIGYMSQRFSLYSELSIKENIRFYGGIYGLSGNKLAQRIDWALQLSGLSGLGDSLVRILSPGFRQRTALACSLLHEPAIVFLDEPTSGVDPLTRRQLWDTIRNLALNGTTVFVTTHYMEEAEYCDRMAFINRGCIMACGSPAELKRKIIKNRIIRINRPVSSVQLEQIRNLEGIFDAYVYGSGFRVVSDNPLISEKIARITGDSSLIAHTSTITPGMEDVFVQLSASHFADDHKKEFNT
jgi:ABC-2 type transport system ATP-binding protein